MKKLFTFLTFGSALVAGAQNLPVSMDPEVQTVLLEEFTGINCPNCVSGHITAADLSNAITELGDVMNTISYHASSNAIPTQDQPDFRTEDGTALFNFVGAVGTPQGVVNRENYDNDSIEANPIVTGEPFPTTSWHTGTSFSKDANHWFDYANAERQFYSGANVAMDVSINTTTRVATCEVEVYYTNANFAAATGIDYLSVAMVEDAVNGPQSNGANNPANYNSDGTYTHNHVFRAFVNSRAGTPIVDANSGIIISNTFTYTIPETQLNTDININHLQFIAILHHGENEYNNSDVIDSYGVYPDYTAGINEENTVTVNAYPNPSNGMVKLNGLISSDLIKITNTLGAEVNYSLNGENLNLEGQTGVFFLNIKRENATKTIRLIVK